MATLTIYSESEFQIIVTYTVNTNSADTYKVTATCSMQAKTPSWFSGTGTAKCGYSANQDYFYIGLGTSATNQQKAAFPVFSNKTLSTSSWTTLATTGSVVYTVTKTHAAQTLTFGVYKTSNTNYEDVTISDGGSYSESYKYLKNVTDKATLSVTARTSYNVAFNANSGSGAPATQTKWYNEALTLSSTRPTRAKYTFKNWNTAQGGTGTSYNPGGSYTANAAATLYAQWTWNHTAPKIESLKVVRCDASGNPDDEGTRCIVTATLKADTATETDAKISSATIKVGSNSAETFTISTAAATIALSKVSSYTVAQDTRYAVAVTATDNKGLTTTKSVLLSPAFFTMDFWGGGANGTDSPGHGVAIGKPCTQANLLDVGLPLQLNADSSNFVGIKTKTANYSGTPIRVYGGADANGDALVMGLGGMVVLGAGESASNLYSALGLSPGDESLHLAADGAANLYAACNTIANRTRLQFGVGAGDHVGAPAVRTDAAANSKVAIGTSSNNGVSVNTNLFSHYTYDKNGFWTSCYVNRADASGGVATVIGVQNKKTDGTNVANYFNIYQRKDGSRGYSITDPAAFRDALGLNTWTTVTAANWITLASGWTVNTITVQHNAALGVVRVYMRIDASAAQTAGNKTLGTVASAYRPKSLSVTLPSLSSYSQACYITGSGSLQANISAVPSGGALYFCGDYFIGA